MQFGVKIRNKIYNVHIWTDSVDAAWHILFCTTVKPETLPLTSHALTFDGSTLSNHDMYGEMLIVPHPNFLHLQKMKWIVMIHIYSLLWCLRVQSQKAFYVLISCTCRRQCQMHCCNCHKTGSRCTSVHACRQQSDERKHFMNTMWCNLSSVTSINGVCTFTEGQKFKQFVRTLIL